MPSSTTSCWSATAFAARDADVGLKLLQQAFDRATADDCVLERAEALRRLALADTSPSGPTRRGRSWTKQSASFAASASRAAKRKRSISSGFTFIASGRRSEAEPPLAARSTWRGRSAIRSCFISVFENLAYSAGARSGEGRLRDEALALVRSTPNARAAECSLLHQWGDEQFVLGRYDQAFRTITEAAACFDEVGDRSRLGRAYVSLGRVYRAHGRLDLALEQYERALGLQQAAGDQLAAVQSLNAIAVTYGYWVDTTKGSRG